LEIFGVYNWPLVAVSVLAAIISSFVAISIVPRIYGSRDRQNSWAWVMAFGMSLGAGIWTMHFIAILALSFPITVTFHLPLTLGSLVLAIIVSASAIYPLRSGGDLSIYNPRTYMIGTVMGLGIAGMHYTGMAAFQMNAYMHHNPSIIVIAVMIAIVASTTALAMANQLRNSSMYKQLKLKAMVSVVMGIAVSAMHYTAMEGMSFHLTDSYVNFESSVAPNVLAIFILVIAVLIQCGIVVSAIFDESNELSIAAAEHMERRALEHKALSYILAKGLLDETLQTKLQTVLEIVLSLDFLAIQRTGSIFVANPHTKVLDLVAEKNLAEPLLKKCKHVPFGKCLCGMAAASQELVYKSGVDDDHKIGYPDMHAHGHYCLPIVLGGELLAVLNLYLDVGYQVSDEEEAFLTLVADAMAAMIKNHNVEENAKKIFTAVDQAGEAVVISDVAGITEYVNATFTIFTGYSKEEAIGQKTSLIKSGVQSQAFYKQMWSTILSGSVWQGELVQKRKDGSYYPAMLTISPSRDNQGKITKFIGIHEDISAHKELEAQFRQAQKMESLGTLVGGIAHDFNNMLAAITGNVFLARANLSEPEQVDSSLATIEQVSQRAADMISQLLTFSKKNLVDKNPLPLISFLSEVLELLKTSIPENIHLELNVPEEELFIFGDRSLLHQVLMNIVINARDAVESVKKPRITLNLDTFYADAEWIEHNPEFVTGNFAHITISDNGKGIAEEEHANIFEPFFTTKPQGKGTGLGLSMVFGAIKSHSGVITVDSKLGKGSSFHIYLPMMENAVPEVELKKVTSGDFVAQGETILLVDDESVVRDSLAKVLKAFGYQVIQAEDGQDGLEKFKQHQADISLAVLDVVMPQMGGFELSKQLRITSPELPVVFMTGYDKDHLVSEESAIPNSEVLTKPANFEHLAGVLRNLLS